MYRYVCLIEAADGFRPIVAIAPDNSVINKGDKIVLEGEGDKTRRTITEGVYMDDKSEEFGLLMKMTKQEKPARIYGKYRFHEFTWEDKADE